MTRWVARIFAWLGVICLLWILDLGLVGGICG